jgi:hypothetical protein
MEIDAAQRRQTQEFRGENEAVGDHDGDLNLEAGYSLEGSTIKGFRLEDFEAPGKGEFLDRTMQELPTPARRAVWLAQNQRRATPGLA